MWILIFIILLICLIGFDEIVRYFSYFCIALLCTIVISIAVRIYIAVSEKEQREYEQSRKQSDSLSRLSWTSTPSPNPSRTPDKIFSGKTYDVLKNNSPFQDNLNYRNYECKAVFGETHRTRTRQIEAFTESDARDKLKALGYIDPIELKQIPFDPPTGAQIESCRNHGQPLPYKACKIDAAYIIDKQINRDSVPNPELVQYATDMRIPLSYYVGKRALYCYIFDALETRDKIAFFTFCIYRYLADDRCGNLNKSFRKEYFYRFADRKIDDQRFVKSMNRYSGDELRYFGKHYRDGREYSGGSTGTIAYKEAVAFLQEMHFV